MKQRRFPSPWQVAALTSSITLGCALLVFADRRASGRAVKDEPLPLVEVKEERQVLFPGSKAPIFPRSKAPLGLGGGSGGAFESRSRSKSAPESPAAEGRTEK